MSVTVITVHNEKSEFRILTDMSEARARNAMATFGNQVYYVVQDGDDVLDEPALLNALSSRYERQANPFIQLVPAGMPHLKRVFVQVSNILHLEVSKEESFLNADDGHGRIAMRLSGE